MRTTHFIPAALLMALVACNNSDDKKTSGTDTTQSTMANDSMNMHHDTSAASITPLPPVPEGAKVSFKNLKDGQKVKSPFKVEFAVERIKLDTAGPIVIGSGHHHLLIDAEDSLAAGTVVLKDAKHLHFGKAQTETTVILPPGTHKLTLQYADGIHRSYGGQLSKTIHVVVE